MDDSGKEYLTLLRNRLNWNMGFYLSKSTALTGTLVPQNESNARLADAQGNPLQIFTNLSEQWGL